MILSGQLFILMGLFIEFSLQFGVFLHVERFQLIKLFSLVRIHAFLCALELSFQILDLLLQLVDVLLFFLKFFDSFFQFLSQVFLISLFFLLESVVFS